MTVDITCILNVFKRVEYFEDQLNAILNQSIPPKKIIIWNNNSEVNMSSYATDNIIVLNSSQNLGVWARFFSQYFLLSGEYVCIFDDDTIPGCNWFKNCVETINKYNALLGTIGVIFEKGDDYNCKLRIGWDGPSDHSKIVDIVGHSWFFRKEWITTFIKEVPNIDEKFLTCGEDIHLSYVLQKYLNIPVVVPPHPLNDKSLWGADYNKSWTYGTDENAISCQNGYKLKFSIALKSYINKGFETIHNKAYSLKIYSNCLEYFIARIKNKQHFAIMKCADGEYSISKNTEIHVQPADDWTFKTDSILHDHFNDTLRLINSNVFYGVSGPSDSKEICDYWYQNIANTHNITYANIFVNKNYSRWIEFLKNADYNCVLISQLYPSSGKLGGMKIVEYLPVDKYLVNKWDDEYENYFKLISKLSRKYTNMLFFVSAGPLANIFIHRMYLENPNNTYIDCGSSIDFFTKGIYTRTYQIDSNVYVDKENLPVVYNDLKVVEDEIMETDLYILKKNFENIYTSNFWNMGQMESRSGAGSTIAYTEYIRKTLVNFIKEKNINNMLDTSCGDWNWMKMIKNNICNYIGIDIVQDIININNELYSSDKIKFLCNDFLTYIKKQPDNSIDLIFCRHTLEHLPTDYNIKFLKECKRVSKYLLVTTYNNKNIQNKELIKDYRPINLKLEPYLNVIDDFYQTEFYDGPSDIYHPECFINVYDFMTVKITGVRAERVKDNFEVVEFRFLTTDDEYDVKYEWWSRMFEYKCVLNSLDKLKANSTSLIHNTSWGFEGCHLTFKNDLDYIYQNSIHSDIKSSSIKNTMVYDITKPISSSFHNCFDFVINISTVEEVNYPTDKILDNLMQQVKPNGYLIITFDYDINDCNSFGNGSMNLSLIENYLNKNIDKMPNNAINGANVVNPNIKYSNLNCGMLVVKKL